MSKLNTKIDRSKKIIDKAIKRWPMDKIAIAWTGGKDSTVLLHLVQTVYGHNSHFPVMFNDSTMEFEEVYDFIESISRQWSLNLHVVEHLSTDLSEFHKASLDKKKELARTMKINAINWALDKYQWQAFMVGIRWDEHQARSQEKYFSDRQSHVRVHPILHFDESDIWAYIKKFNVPYVSLYDKGYRSLGEKPFTKPATAGGNERSGRDFDKEQLMKKLRDMGYW